MNVAVNIVFEIFTLLFNIILPIGLTYKSLDLCVYVCVCVRMNGAPAATIISPTELLMFY